MKSKKFILAIIAISMIGISVMSGCTQRNSGDVTTTKSAISLSELDLDGSYSKYGLSFKYPFNNQISEKLAFEKIPIEDAGGIEGMIDKKEIYLYWFVSWVTTNTSSITDGGARAIDEGSKASLNYLVNQSRLKLTKKDLVTIENNGHQIRCQPFEADNYFGTKHYYGVISGFYCNQSQRIYQIMFFSDKEDVFPLFEKVLKTFKCH
jgi:hypothetical protein